MGKIALLIGISNYERSDEFPRLPAARKDVYALKEVLENPKIGGFPPVQVMIDSSESQSVLEEIEKLFVNGKKDDLLLLYFSGHGVLDERNLLHLCTYKTRKNLLGSTAIPCGQIHDFMKKSKAKQQVVILDCCFSGAFGEGMTVKGGGHSASIGGRIEGGRAVLTSCSPHEYSLSDSELSVYTHYLVEGLATGAADADGNGSICARELHEYTRDRVRTNTPDMDPKIFAASEGYNIALADVIEEDPKRIYRRAFEGLIHRNRLEWLTRTKFDDLIDRFSRKPRKDYRISFADQSALEERKDQLGLTYDVIADIEIEVLRPYRELQKKLWRYEQIFIKTFRVEKSINSHVREGLTDFQRTLGLQEEQTKRIEEKIIRRARRFALDQPSQFLPPLVRSAFSPWITGSAFVFLVGISAFLAVRFVQPLNPPISDSSQESVPLTPEPTPSQPPQSIPEPAMPEEPSLNQGLFHQERLKPGKTMEEYREAIEFYTKKISRDQANRVDYEERGFAYFSTKKYKNAIDDYTKALYLKPDDRTRSRVLYMRGQAYLRENSQSLALADCIEAIQFDSKNADAYLLRSQIHEQMGDISLAVKECNNAKALYAEDPKSVKNGFYANLLQRCQQLQPK